ncbi:MAG: hypothetical protein M0D55_05275 [Elusimicrobiota bacterium]|nr:MAG: hypothetical protein M0D55_05275 [Elusimicrobiota bacterium]
MRILAAACLMLPLSAAAVDGGWSEKVAVARSPEQTAASWPDEARMLARDMTARYGRPDEASPDAFVWYNNGPWKKTIVHRQAWPHYAYQRDKDYLENVIGHAVPEDRVADLSRFDRRLDFDPVTAELSARSESESANYLLLNLADEVIRGKKDPAEAREFRDRMLRLSAAGKSSAYLTGFLFDVHNDLSPYPRRR